MPDLSDLPERAETFGEMLRRARKHKELSGAALARLLHVPPTCVSQWETDRRIPSAMRVLALHLHLELPLQELAYKYLICKARLEKMHPEEA